MFQTSILASGSKGNSILVTTEKTALLLDAGLSGIRILNAMDKIGFDPSKINALLISHEHSDHIRGAGIVCRKLKIPLYITESTFSICKDILGKLGHGVHNFVNGKNFQIDNLIITPFNSSHDVVDGSNFVIRKIGDPIRKLAIATDLGYGSRLMINKIQNSSTIILESNHDLKMLLEGPYPWHLKQRIKSRHGHLSNEQAIGVLTQIIHPGIKNLCLAHLSEVNNKPDLVRSEIERFFKDIRLNVNLVIATQDEPTKLLNV